MQFVTLSCVKTVTLSCVEGSSEILRHFIPQNDALLVTLSEVEGSLGQSQITVILNESEGSEILRHFIPQNDALFVTLSCVEGSLGQSQITVILNESEGSEILPHFIPQNDHSGCHPERSRRVSWAKSNHRHPEFLFGYGNLI